LAGEFEKNQKKKKKKELHPVTMYPFVSAAASPAGRHIVFL
jgi:hypothetical protein